MSDEEKSNRIKELEKDRHELLEKIKAIKEVLNIEEIYHLEKKTKHLVNVCYSWRKTKVT